jgi:hypothetical protein
MVRGAANGQGGGIHRDVWAQSYARLALHQVSPVAPPRFWRDAAGGRVAACVQAHRARHDDAADPAGCRTAAGGRTRYSGGHIWFTPASCVTRPPGSVRPGVAITRSSCIAQVSAPS